MKMKYFRFLFGEIGQCFVHLGELKDTRTEEHFTFMYLRKAERRVSQRKGTEHRLFLCPEDIDLLILGQKNISIEKDLGEFLERANIDILVAPEKCEISSSLLRKTRKVLKLGALHQEAYDIKAAGWNFYVRGCNGNSVMLIHGLSKKHAWIYEEKERRDIASTAANDFEKGQGGESFEDCVMNIKAVDGSNRCCEETCPDAYGCALGCVLHRDHDVCKAQGCIASYMLGTIVLPGIPEPAAWARLEECRENLEKIRFFGIPDMKEELKKLNGRDSSESGCRRYFVGMSEELSDKTIAEAVRSGLQYRMAALQPGQGLCCSGFLKYAEDK